MIFRKPYLLTLALGCAGVQATADVDYQKDIRPILQRSCVRCHSGATPAAGIRLDNPAAMLAARGGSGSRAISPHNPAGSGIITRISASDASLKMPPTNSGLAALSPAEVNLLKDWIEHGPSFSGAKVQTAPVQQHWSLKPLIKPAVPAGDGGPWSRSPIDRFVLARLRKAGIAPSAPADKRTLLRRVTVDLTGLGPTVAEMRAFVADTRPDAYERVVDRLLGSPRYGERWARHWLDTVHYADSHGFEHDIGRDNGWPYRDYVISALNSDIAYTRFIKEQLAADYFYPEHTELTPALGYLGAGTFDLSAYTTAPKNFALIDRDDLVNQTMSAFVSTTANCARCHNHKFDPIPQTDYYAVQAVFSGLTKGDRTYDAAPGVSAARARWMALRAGAERKDAAALGTPEARSLVNAWRTETAKRVGEWAVPTISTVSSEQGSDLSIEAGGVVVAGGTRPARDTYTVVLKPQAGRITGVKLDLFTSQALPHGGPGRMDNGNLHLSEVEVSTQSPSGVRMPIKLAGALADFNQDGWGVERALDGDEKTAWGIYPAVGRPHAAVFKFAGPVDVEAGSTLTIRLKQLHGGGHLIGRFRLSVSGAEPATLAPLTADIEPLLQKPLEQLSSEQQLDVAAMALKIIADKAISALPLQKTVYAAGADVSVPTVGRQQVMKPAEIHLLERGDVEKPREVVPPGALSAITALQPRFALKAGDTDTDASRRAGLANWIADKGNVLTWRSVVNRVWHYHFGRGICDTPGDLGHMGGVPSHPELVDWLAVWFRDDAGGSLKKLHRLMVTSQAYRQSSTYRADASRKDGDNRLLWRFNRLRLDADSIRDIALETAGTLDYTMGGPGVNQFTKSPGPQLTPTLDYAKYDWSSPGSSRRSIYRTVWRGIADPFMEALDFPDLGLLAPARTFSVSALQALELYNNPFMLHTAREFAASISKEIAAGTKSVNPEERALRMAVERAWLRQPSPSELTTLRGYSAKYGLEATCRVLLNSNEFLFVD